MVALVVLVRFQRLHSIDANLCEHKSSNKISESLPLFRAQCLLLYLLKLSIIALSRKYHAFCKKAKTGFSSMIDVNPKSNHHYPMNVWYRTVAKHANRAITSAPTSKSSIRKEWIFCWTDGTQRFTKKIHFQNLSQRKGTQKRNYFTTKILRVIGETVWNSSRQAAAFFSYVAGITFNVSVQHI